MDNYSHFFYWSGPNVHDLWRNGTEVFHAGEYFPDLMVQEAVRFMEQHRERPFFLYYALNTPHYPYQGDAKWVERFQHLPYPRNLYAAFLAAQDERLGRLFAAVDTLGLRSRTIIVFHSDNGHSTEERAHFGGGSAGPYRGAKFSLFEGGIRLPAIVSWPGSIPENEVRNQVAHACDLLPTLAELTGVPRHPSGWTVAVLPVSSRTAARPARTRSTRSIGRSVRDRMPSGRCVRATGSSWGMCRTSALTAARAVGSRSSWPTLGKTPAKPPIAPTSTPTWSPAFVASTSYTWTEPSPTVQGRSSACSF
ncbi:MAG: sulfatase-like hydrolase/transferase [Verrucomicrobia bacterium]|nr:sulfatase-like hydrolase/transferase [Verrucomicrobiota bacterium]